MVHTFPKGINLEVNVIGRLEFELFYFKDTVHHFSHYIIGTTLNIYIYIYIYIYIHTHRPLTKNLGLH